MLIGFLVKIAFCAVMALQLTIGFGLGVLAFEAITRKATGIRFPFR